MNNQKWAIICGAVRNKFEIYSLLTRLLELRKKNFIQGIVFSTWINELDNVPGLRKKLENLSITIVESKPLEDSLKSYTNLLFIRQCVQLQAALDVIPDDVFVLKCRTDLSLGQVNTFLDQFDENKLEIKERNIFNIDLHYKIYVSYLSISDPFTCSDISFFGHKRDIQKMINFESVRQYVRNIEIWSDALFHIYPFLHRFDALSDFFRIVNYFSFGRLMRCISKGINDNYLPTMLCKFYAFYLKLIDSVYVHHDSTYVDSTDFTIEDIFTNGTKNKQVYTTWFKGVYDSRIIHHIVSGDLVHTPMYENISSELLKINASEEYVRNISYSLEECEEFKTWISRNVSYFKESLFLRRQYAASDHPLDLETDQIIEYLFDLKNNNEHDLTIKGISKSIYFIDYYKELEEYSQGLDSSSNFYEQCLFTASRTLNFKTLCKIAKMLKDANVRQENIPLAEFIFLRNGRESNNIMFHVPQGIDRLISNLLFLEYGEKKYPTYTNLFINNVAKYYLPLEKIETLENFKKKSIEVLNQTTLTPSGAELLVAMVAINAYEDKDVKRILQRVRLKTIIQPDSGSLMENNNFICLCGKYLQFNDLLGLLSHLYSNNYISGARLLFITLIKTHTDHQLIKAIILLLKYDFNNIANIQKQIGAKKTLSFELCNALIDADKSNKLALDKNILKQSNSEELGIIWDCSVNHGWKLDQSIICEMENYAKKEDNDSILRLAKSYYYGKPTSIDYIRSLEWLEIAERNGQDVSMLKYLCGCKLSLNQDFLVNTLLKGYKSGNAQAALALSKYYHEGTFLQKSDEKALDCLYFAINHNLDVDNVLLFDLCCLFSRKEDITTIKSIIAHNLNTDNVEMTIRLARCFSKGIVVERNLQLAIKYYTEAINKNSRIAVFELFDLYWNLGSDLYHPRMLPLIEPLLNQNDGAAHMRIARMYRDGKGIEKNIENSMKSMIKAIESDYEWAAVELFDLIRENKQLCCEIDFVKKLKPLADRNNGAALLRIGIAYLEGINTKKDTNKAKYYLEKAKQNGQQIGAEKYLLKLVR